MHNTVGLKSELKNSRQVVRTFFLLVAFATAGLLLITGAAWEILKKENVHHICQTESERLSTNAGDINGKLTSLLADLHYLENSRELIEFLDDPSPSHTDSVGEEFLDIAKAKLYYDHIRFIDLKGMEVVRVAVIDGNVVTTPPSKLQDKSSSYYHQQTIHLDPHEVYISRMDLNIEQGKIESPHKPMIRITTPLADSAGVKRGFLVLNYLADDILSPLRETDGRSHFLMANDLSYYLLGESDRQWGFMYPDNQIRSAARLNLDYPDVWDFMQDRHTGTFTSKHGLFSFTTIDPHRVINSNNFHNSLGATDLEYQDFHWHLISHIPRPQLDLLLAGTWRMVTGGFVCLLLISVLICLLVAQQMARRKYAEGKLKHSESRIRGILEAATDAIITIDTQGIILSANPATVRMFGYRSHELIGSSVDVLMGQEFSHLVHRHIIATQLTPVATQPGTQNLGLTGRRKDGSEFPLEHSITKVEVDSEVVFNGMLRDITERKKIEEEHRASEERFKRLSELASEAIYLIENGKIIDCNSAAAEMMGYSQSELIGLSILDLVPDHRREEVSSRFKERSEGNFEDIGLRKDQSSFPIGIHARYIPYQEREVRVAAVQDLTIHKENEQLALQQKELEAIHVTTATHAHEINNPLTGISGVLQVLSQENMSIDAHSMVAEARGAVQRIKDVILQMERMGTPQHRPYVGGKQILDLRDPNDDADVG